jgi:two-component system LytT family response regulator
MTPRSITALIVDDEPLGRELIRHMLGAHADIQVVGEYGDGEKALAALRRRRPDVVFLDVRMPRIDGLEVLSRLQVDGRPLVVFVTAYDAYAVKAFEAQALDYLLKPFDQERFDRMLGRVRQRIAQLDEAALGQGLRKLVAGHATTAPPPPRAPDERIAVKDGGRVTFVPVAELMFVEASGNYVALRTRGGRTHLVHETMAAMEARLDPAKFVRIHRSTIVNVLRIRQLEPHFNGEYVVLLDDGTRLKLSRTYADAARAVLGLA